MASKSASTDDLSRRGAAKPPRRGSKPSVRGAGGGGSQVRGGGSKAKVKGTKGMAKNDSKVSLASDESAKASVPQVVFV